MYIYIYMYVYGKKPKRAYTACSEMASSVQDTYKCSRTDASATVA